MTRSTDETDIRDAVVARLRELLPSARIVHELNVAGTGSNRIDVAAVSPDSIVAVEIKSKKDSLDRLEKQWAAFSACSHFVVIAAHEKHFIPNDGPFPKSKVFLNHPLFFGRWHKLDHVWRYPAPDGKLWRIDWPYQRNVLRRQPHAEKLLEMLWAEELRAECERHRLPCHRRISRRPMIQNMVWHMTGREICEAVCRQLRSRNFVEADPPILDRGNEVAA